MRRAWFLAGLAAFTLAGAALLPPAAARASTVAPQYISSGTRNVTSGQPGCTSAFDFYVNWPPGESEGYGWVRWDANPCGYAIQARSYCAPKIPGSASGYRLSGVVTGVGVKDGPPACTDEQYITRFDDRFRDDGNWSDWVQLWARPGL